MKRQIPILLFLVLAISVYANKELDSLKMELAKAEGFETTFDLYLTIADRYVLVNSDSSEKYILKAGNQLDKLTNKDLIAQYYLTNGKYLQSIFEIDSAISVLHSSYQLFHETNNIIKIILVGNELGNAFFSLNNLDSSAYYYQEILRVSDSSEQPHSYAAYLNNIANIYELQNNKTEMLNNYIRALEIFKLLDEKRAIAIALNNIASIYHDVMNDHENAIKYSKEAAKINAEVNNLRQLLNNYNTLSLVYRDLDLFDSAKYFIRKAINIAENSNFPYSVAQSQHNLGSIFLKEKKYDSASIGFEKSLKICKQYGITDGTVYNLIHLGQIYTEIDKYNNSEKCLSDALKICDSADLNLEVRSAIIEDFKDLFSAKGDYKTAFSYYAELETIEDSLNKVSLSNKIQEITAKYESEQKELENKRLKAENKNQELIISRQRIIMVVSVISALTAILMIAMILSIRKNRKRRLIILEAKNKKIEEQSIELDRLNKTKDKLFSIISHDLRSPFSALLGFVSIIESELKNKNYDDALKYTEQLHISTKSTYDLLENLLSWSRSQQNKIVIEKTQINLNILVDSLILTLKHSADNKSVVLANRIPQNTIISTDKNILSVVLRNLISNSIKFTDKQGIIEIISAFITKDNIKIIVRDTGIGMSEELVSKIESTEGMFSTAGTDKEEGTGLGLIMVKEFLNRLDSKLEVKSEKGKGSEFSFCLQLN